MATQSVKKKEGGLFNFQDFKKKNMTVVSTTANKPQPWIKFPEAYQKQTGLPGIPCCKLSIVRGWSDTGKSTIRNLAIAAAMEENAIPVIFSTDGDFSFEYAKACGMKIEPVYGDRTVVDPITGEETILHNQIIDWEGDYLLFTPTSINEYCGDVNHAQGKHEAKKRGQAVIEDVAYIINDLLDQQAAGNLPRNLFFVWDSVGSLSCYKGWASKGNNAQWNAFALNNSFETIVGRINATIELGQPYENTMLWIAKIWNDTNASPTPGIPSIKEKGGNAMKYFNRLTIHMGKKLSAGVKKLKATCKGVEYQYGTLTAIEIAKNHLDAPFNMTQSGTLVCVGNGIICEEDVDAYKKAHMSEMVAQLQKKLAEAGRADEKIDESAIVFSDEESEND